MVDRGEGDGRRGARGPMPVDEGVDVEVGENVAVAGQEGVVDTRLAGGKTDGPGGVKRFGLDGVANGQAGALSPPRARSGRCRQYPHVPAS